MRRRQRCGGSSPPAPTDPKPGPEARSRSPLPKPAPEARCPAFEQPAIPRWDFACCSAMCRCRARRMPSRRPCTAEWSGSRWPLAFALASCRPVRSPCRRPQVRRQRHGPSLLDRPMPAAASGPVSPGEGPIRRARSAPRPRGSGFGRTPWPRLMIQFTPPPISSGGLHAAEVAAIAACLASPPIHAEPAGSSRVGMPDGCGWPRPGRPRLPSGGKPARICPASAGAPVRHQHPERRPDRGTSWG